MADLTIWLDINAAGWGWFIDATPGNDSEYLTPGDQGEQGRMDLLTVLDHKIGHLLGSDHADGGVMADTLAEGVRRTPAAGSSDWVGAVDVLFADLLQASSHGKHGWYCHRDPICK